MGEYAVTPAIRAAMAATWRERAARYEGLRPFARERRGVDFSPWSEMARKIEACEYVECPFRSLPAVTRADIRATEQLREFDRVSIAPSGAIAKLPESLIDKYGPRDVLFPTHGTGKRSRRKKR